VSIKLSGWGAIKNEGGAQPEQPCRLYVLTAFKKILCDEYNIKTLDNKIIYTNFNPSNNSSKIPFRSLLMQCVDVTTDKAFKNGSTLSSTPTA
jgi:hypothetical protein